jgi:hypothetical protein
MRLAASLGQGLLIGGDRRFALALELPGFGDGAVDVRAPFIEDRADARQRHLRHHHIEKDEGDSEPGELGRERFLVERRKHALVPARHLGVRSGFSHRPTPRSRRHASAS